MNIFHHILIFFAHIFNKLLAYYRKLFKKSPNTRFKETLHDNEKHGANDLIILDQLSELAQAEANRNAANECDDLSNRIVFDGNEYGVNSSVISHEHRKTPHMVVREWYNEIFIHSFQNDYQENTTKFTQIVWKGTQYVGIGTSMSPNSNWYVVVLYSPRGLVPDKYKENVEERKKRCIIA
ncbi:hypothetical protein SNEBB_004553 [Seison nebaliae]|nr:hypothetical protein SNEBB_004553 [Seison nebaliae]